MSGATEGAIGPAAGTVAGIAGAPTIPDADALHERLVRSGGEEYLVLSVPLPRAEPVAELTPAERQVAELLRRRLGGAAIARLLGRAPRTIANQTASVFRKLGVCSRRELIALLGRRP